MISRGLTLYRLLFLWNCFFDFFFRFCFLFFFSFCIWLLAGGVTTIT